MQSREQLEKRVTQLESQLSALGRGGLGARGIRTRAAWGFGDLPFYDIAIGPNLERGEIRGHARGFIAIGDIATGVFALGGIARGVVALGGVAIGLFTFGGLSLGILTAVGGLAIGGLALGGGALGGVALGGGAVGYYACGGGAAGEFVVSVSRRDPEARVFFKEHGLGRTCGA